MPADTTSPADVSLHAAIRLTGNLNALGRTPLSAEVAAREVVGPDVAHHVFDPSGLLGLDQDGTGELEPALNAATLLGGPRWALAIPRPGALAPLRGPATFNAAALGCGAAVLAVGGGIGWLPHQVGRAIQWQLAPAAAPVLNASPAETERRLSEVILRTAAALDALDMTSGVRPGSPGVAEALLPAAYGSRAQRAVHRALGLLAACEAGLADESGLLHSYAIEVRGKALRELQGAAIEALCAAVTWVGD